MPTHLKLLRHIAALLLAALVSQPTIASAQAPIITVGPVHQIVSAGTAVTFSVTATGTAPLTYQWSKNGVAIPGAVNLTYTVSNAQLTDVAAYEVTVSNASGPPDVAGAALFILPTGSFNGSDAFSTARNTTLWGVNNFATAGSALSESGGKLVLMGTASAANNFEVSDGRVWQSGVAPYASDWTAEVDVTVPNAVFTGSAGDTDAHWGLTVFNAGDLRDGVSLSFAAFARAGTVTSRFVGASLGVDGNYGLPSSTFSSASQNLGESVRLRLAWSAATKFLSVAYVDVGVTKVLGSFQLGSGALQFVNCNAFVLVLSGTTEGMSPQGLLVADNFTTTQLAASQAPIITVGPVDQIVSAGTAVTFSVTATGTAPLTYQWSKNGVAIPGAVNPTYTVSNAQLTDVAGYEVTVSNASGPPDVGGAALFILPTGSFNGSDAFSTARNTTLWGVNNFATAGSALSESGGKLVLMGTASAANNFEVSDNRAWQTGVAPYASDWTAEVDVTVPNAVFTGSAGDTWADWGLTVFNAGDLRDGVRLSFGAFASAGTVTRRFLDASLVVDGNYGLPGSAFSSASQNLGESVRLRLAWSAATKFLSVAYVDGGVTNVLGSFQLGSGTFQFANCNAFVLVLSGTTEGMSPQGLLVADNFTTTQLLAAAVAPIITVGPVDQIVSAGTAVTFSVTATGTAPLTYQWLKNGVLIGSAITASFTVNSAQPADVADYTVVVSNAQGTDDASAVLAILPTGSFAGLDTFSTARNTTLWGVNDIASAGSALSEGGGKLVLMGTASAANNFEVSAGRAWQSGLAPYASDWAAEVDVTLPNAVFTGSAGPTSAKWELNAYNAGDLRDKLELHFEAFTSAGTVTSRFVRSRLDVDGNEGLPGNAVQSASGNLGESVRLRLVWSAATQSLSVAYVDGGVTNVLGSFTLGSGIFQFANCTGFLITLSGETEGISPVATMVADNFTTTQPAASQAPIITVGPVDQIVSAGTAVTFSVLATGSGLTYQWRKDGVAIGNATSATLTLNSVTRAASGVYSVVVTSGGSSTTSGNATLRVIVPQQLSSRRGGSGQFQLLFTDPDTAVGSDLARFEVHHTANFLGASTVWVTNSGSFTLSSGKILFDDTGSVGTARRFYRVIEK